VHSAAIQLGAHDTTSNPSTAGRQCMLRVQVLRYIRHVLDSLLHLQ
jgi:hypothetical protein